MKKKLISISLLAVLLLGTGAYTVFADAYDAVIKQRNSDDSDDANRFLALPDGERTLFGSTPGRDVVGYVLGNGFTYNSATNKLETVGMSQASVESLVNTKADVSHTQSISTVTGLQAQLDSFTSWITSGDNSFANFLAAIQSSTSTQYNASTSAHGLMTAADKVKVNATPVVQRVRAQTNTSGVYTWTFPTQFASDPIVTAVVENSSSNVLLGTKITAISTSSVSIQVNKVESVLGILEMSSPQSFVHITAVSP